jgi:hypothetical protein
MTSDELTACSNLFLHPGFQCLQSLTIARVSENGNWELDPFFHVLRGRLSPATFAEVILCKDDGNSWSPSEENQRKITFNTLIPLLSFPNLSVLKIELDVHVELDDAAIRMAAQAWPCLRIFRLYEQSTRTIPAITPAGLLSLIVSCPNLEQLTLRMNMLNVPSFAQLGDIIPARNLYRLDVCTSPIKHSAWVASFLTIAFPVLSDLVYGWQYSNDDGMHELPDLGSSETIDHDEWEAVQQLLGPIMASHNSGYLEWEYT